MDAHEQRIVEFLSTPQTYPGVSGAVARRETHVSHVFLAGDYAYKLKKPVKFPFLDASTLALRRKYCQLELTLNRRTAPDIYLGMVPITETAGVLRLGGAGKVIEWVVKMRRLPEARMMDKLIAQRAVTRREIAQIGERLASFFRKAGRSRAITHYGEPAQVESLLLGNVNECQLFVGKLLPESDRDFLRACYRQWISLYLPVLARRARDGRIIDGHGDLRCENICLTNPPNIFDCVEFEPAFRCADQVNDFSFLVMDLEFRRRMDLANVLVQTYRKRVSDPTFDDVLTVYKCHRSLVRGKVRGFSWLQHPRTAEGRRIRELSRRHFQLGVEYAKQFAPPRIVMVGGLIGSGKSTLAKHLVDGLGAVWLRTDEIRINEFAAARKQGDGFGEGLYSAKVSDMVYAKLLERTAAAVKAGQSVVCDGMFSKAVGRRAVRAIAKKHGASFHFIECTVPRAVALRRVAKRYESKSDISEARPEHYDRLKAGYEPITELSASEWTKLSDNRAPSATYQAALQTLRRAWNIPS